MAKPLYILPLRILQVNQLFCHITFGIYSNSNIRSTAYHDSFDGENFCGFLRHLRNFLRLKFYSGFMDTALFS